MSVASFIEMESTPAALLTEVDRQLTKGVWPGIYSYEVYRPETNETIRVGGALMHLFGLHPETMVNFRSAGYWVNYIHPDDLRIFVHYRQLDVAGSPASPITSHVVYFRQMTLDGRQLQVMYQQKHLFDQESGLPAAVLAITVDVSHLRPPNASAMITRLDMADGEFPEFTVLEQAGESATSDLLTYRELSVLELLANGKTSKQAAYSLKISPNTIDTHRRRILMKTKTSSITEAVAKAIRNGWFGTKQRISGSMC